MCNRWNEPIKAAIIAGSGFSSIIEVGKVIDRIPYSLLPGLPQSTISGHGSELLLASTPYGLTIIFTGRSHAYEGHKPSACASHAALALEVGVQNLIMTNACGGLHPRLNVGDVVIPTDVMNMTFRALRSPARNHSEVVDRGWALRSTSQCWVDGIPARNGTLVQVLGPSFETRAEIGMMRRCGADVIGMSTVVESAWASGAGARVSVLSLVTNTLTDTHQQSVTHLQVMDTASTSGKRVSQALLSILQSIQESHSAP
ncbi:MAG: purine-nucleoside phosphorylase [Candidatus Kapabacteria bacterium]|nr:purine-nucleoside phosphorylase [Candidatus Kapabacteria bacterium]